MRFLIVTHVLHKKAAEQYYAYGPYVREMNLWLKHVQEVTVIAPITTAPADRIDIAYDHANIRFIAVRQLDFTSFLKAIQSLYFLPGIIYKMAKAMRQAGHIHLRCPGNMGLIGCMVQVFFPSKVKTAKYAGNWDFRSRQPFTYRLQQLMLRNTSLTKNMTALVYGDWPDSTKNIRAFFTASYNSGDQDDVQPRRFDEIIRLIFVGTLSTSKQPMISAKVCQSLRNEGYNAELHIYGEGVERKPLEEFINSNQLKRHIILHGNQPAHVVKQAFRNSHFLVFISRSEGWPKAVAEAMWWGCLPVTTQVSCTPEMLGYGERGELVGNSIEEISSVIKANIHHPEQYEEKCRKGMEWARNYTVELFESEIKNMII